MKYFRKYQVLFALLLGLQLGFGSSLPNDTYWHQKLDHQASQLLDSAHAKYPSYPSVTESEATAWFRASQFERAFPVLEAYPVRGSHRAQLEIAFMYQYGLGVSKDLRTAALWYYIAADPVPDNLQPMQRGLNTYFGLDGNAVNFSAAAEWFQMAAELSDDRY